MIFWRTAIFTLNLSILILLRFFEKSSSHGDMFVGQQMGGGRIHGIYPGLDKFTIAHTTASGSRIVHRRISEHGSKTDSCFSRPGS